MASPPKTRGDCLDGPRPCPWIGCRYHLAGDAAPGAAESCCLDLADLGGMKLVDVGALLGVTKQRAEQIERAALEKLRKRMGRLRIGAGDFAHPEGGQFLEDDDE